MAGERGVKGDKGDAGATGHTGATGRAGATGQDSVSPLRRRIAYLFILMFTLAALNLIWSYHLTTENNGNRCALIDKVSAIPVPHPLAGNPSREAIAQISSAFRERGRELGCGT